MPSRIQLEHRARVVGIDPANYVNDSQLEQRIIYDENNAVAVTGTLSSGTLTSDATAVTDGDTVTIGPIVYTAKTALTEVKATNTLTSNNTQVTEGDKVNVNGIVYTFKATPTLPYDVHLVTNADTSLGNLANAINLTGTPGTDYGTGTAVHPTVSSSSVSSHILTFTALTVGTAGNRYILQTGAATLTAGNDFFSGGVAPVGNQVLIGSTADGSAFLTNLKAAILGTTSKGTTFSNGTNPHPLVTGSTLTGTTLLVRGTKAASGLTIATTKTSTHLSWGNTTMQTAVQAVIAAPTYSAAGQDGGALV